MKIEEIIKKYDISYSDGRLRARVDGITDKEIELLVSLKSELLAYFKEKENRKEKMEAETLEKAIRMENGLFLVIDYDLRHTPCVLVARRLCEKEKLGYSEWFQEIGFVAVGCRSYLDHMNFADMPKRKADGTFLGGSNSAWIITPEEYDRYIKENQKRELDLKEKEEAARKLEMAYRNRAKEEKEVLLSKVDNWEITEHEISDEGGKTTVYIHQFRIGDEKLSFAERSVFDLGVVINPEYDISTNCRGGIALNKNGSLDWYTLDNNSWSVVRPLTENESICHSIISKYGKFSKTTVRM